MSLILTDGLDLMEGIQKFITKFIPISVFYFLGLLKMRDSSHLGLERGHAWESCWQEMKYFSLQ